MLRMRHWLLLAALSLVSCSGRGAEQPTPGGAAHPSTAAFEPKIVQEEPGFAVEVLAGGLDTPWDLAFAPDGRIFVTERPGRVRIFQDGRLLSEPAAVIEEVAASGEGGLLGIALDPGFAENHLVYIYYTHRSSGGVANRVARYTERNGQLTQPEIVFDAIEGAGIHNGGRLAFGPDGMLYITTGDAADPDLSQNLQSPAGKIHRINPDGSIPADNPFAASSVYSYGHRNPQGLAWQPGSGRLYATEHGSSAYDEVNRINAGSNYGWPLVRGAEHGGEYAAPVIHSQSTTWAPSGATFVSGERFAEWQGDLLFGGLRSSTLWRLTLASDGEAEALEPLLQGYGRIRAVQQGPDGLIYLLTSNRDGRGSPQPEDDRLLRIVPR